MQHSFDIDIAKEYGILEAILLNHMWFWIKKNEANDMNYFDGNYWTYNSTRAFNELFPYVSQRQIQNALNHLKEQEIILTGNYNKSAYDRTLWYAFSKKGKCIMQKCKMEDAEKGNGLCENVKPIPDINTNINQINNNNNIYDFLQENGFVLSPIHYEIISKWEDNDLTRYAIKQAVLNNKYNIKYIQTILYSYEKDNIKTIQQAKEREEAFNKNKSNKVEKDTPEWFNKEQTKQAITKEDEKEFEELIKGITE